MRLVSCRERPHNFNLFQLCWGRLFMTEKHKDGVVPEFEEREEDVIVFDIDAVTAVSSAELLHRADASGSQEIDMPKAVEPGKTEAELSPIFKELATPRLPELQKENRAKLLMQSPTRIFLYWSLRKNPYQILHRLFGDNIGSYTLALKLANISTGNEEIKAIEAEGSWWFNVAPDAQYQAEIGFYAPNRPFIRVTFSNIIATPRKSPSPRRATSVDWMVSADKFARVLDVAGFKQDAFEVAIAGDEQTVNENFSPSRFASFVGQKEQDVSGISAEEIRFAIMALAAGVPLEFLKWKVGSELFALFQANFDKLSGEIALAALRENFGLDAEDFEFEEAGPAVFGASLVNFPKRFKYKRSLPEYAPISSGSIS